MDIDEDDAGFISGKINPTTFALYRFSLANGAETKVGDFPEEVDDLAILPRRPIAMTAPAAAVSEDAGSVQLTVARADAATTESVAYTTKDGSAGAADYTPASGTLTFAPGEQQKTITVPIANDSSDEPQESFDVSLSQARGGAVVGAPSLTTVTIFDDDAPAVAPPPPPPPPPADASAPRVLLSAPSSLPVKKLARGLSGSFSCSEACSANFTLALGKTSLGSAGAALTSGDVGSFKIAIARTKLKAVRKKLKKRRSVKLKLSATATDSAANAGGATATVTVSRR
jgi:hypothetical protein